MFNLLFGITTGLFVYGLIVQFHQKESAWANYRYIYAFSILMLCITICVGWPLLKSVFS